MNKPRRYGPPTPRYPYGPKCLEHTDANGQLIPECPYRSTSFGYAPLSSPNVELVDEAGTPHVDFGPGRPGVSGSGGGTVRERRVDDSPPFLFLLEALGPDEVEQGRNAIGPTGRKFTAMLHDNTPLRRNSQAIANTVRCRPVEWEACESGGQQPVVLDYNKDHKTAKPSPGQIRECAKRYTDQMLEDFDGHTIVALGKTALEYATGRTHSIGDNRGNIWEPGLNKPCEVCDEKGRVSGRPIKCKQCKGRGTRKCSFCAGVTKHRKSCTSGEWGTCDFCSGAKIQPGKPKKCPTCNGSCVVPIDPTKPYVSERLKPDQLLFATYHPSAINHNPPLREIVERDLSRVATLREELVEVEDVRYDIYPSEAEWLATANIVSIDLETSGSFNPEEGQIRCWGATDRTGYGAVFARGEERRLRNALACPTIIGQNFVLYDQWWLEAKGFPIPPETRIIDTRYLGKLLNPDTPNDLVYLTGMYADPPIRGYWKTKNDYRDRIEEVCAIDIDATLRVYYGQRQELEERGQWGIVENYIVPLSRVIHDMRLGGMRINRDRMDETRQVLEGELTELRQIFPWKLNDPKRPYGTESQYAKISEWLYEDHKLPVQKNKGAPTSNRGALEELRSRLELEHKTVAHISDDESAGVLDVIQSLQTARDKSKLSNAFLKYKLDRSDYIHPALNIGGSARGKHEPGRGTATWRFSCTDPNAQQVPPSARSLFVPDGPDDEIASIDLRQAEVVGFLWYAEAWEVLNNVLNGYDAHRMVADAIGIERTDAKNTTFAILYGETERTTAARTGTPVVTVKEVREQYFRALPGVAEYRRRTIEESRRLGYVTSPFGFRRYVKATSSNGRAANMACNMPIQNIPPVIIGRAMIGLHRDLKQFNARILMQVHDELVINYPKHLRKQVLGCVIDWMRSPVPELAAPTLGMAGGLVFNVDVEVGPSWGQLTKINEELGI